MSVIPLLPKSQEYNDVFNLVIQSSKSNVTICSIDKIILHPEMEKVFYAKMESIKQLRSGCEIKTLFHGTSEIGIRSIIDEGFDLERCKTCVYGKGVYFSTDASYSLGYAKNTKKQNVVYMFLCDVLVGKCKKGHSNEELDTSRFDNFVNKLSNPTIYVTTHMDGILPKYVIELVKK